MTRFITLLIFAFLLAGCANGAITTFSDRYHVVLAPESLYRCPVITVFPKVETLTDLQTAKLLVAYAENNAICRSSLDAIHKFYQDARAKFEQVSQ